MHQLLFCNRRSSVRTLISTLNPKEKAVAIAIWNKVAHLEKQKLGLKHIFQFLRKVNPIAPQTSDETRRKIARQTLYRYLGPGLVVQEN